MNDQIGLGKLSNNQLTDWVSSEGSFFGFVDLLKNLSLGKNWLVVLKWISFFLLKNILLQYIQDSNSQQKA